MESSFYFLWPVSSAVQSSLDVTFKGSRQNKKNKGKFSLIGGGSKD